MSGVVYRSLLLGFVGLLVSTDPALAYLGDSGVHVPPDYFTALAPEAGRRYTDPTFGTTLKRVSDALVTPNLAFTGRNLIFIMNEYATMSPFNQDNSRLLLLHQSYFALYDGSGNYLRDLPLEINSRSEPRWSRSQPNLLFYLNGNQLKTYDVATNTISAVRTFAEYTTVYGGGESDISFDGDHFVFVGDSKDVFVYEISSDTKEPVLDTTGLGDFDSLHLSPDGNVLIHWYAGGEGRYRGVELYDRNMQFLRQLSPWIGHSDVTRDVSGEEVLLLVNAGNPRPPVECQNAIVKIRLSDAHSTCLISFHWSLAQHVSAPDGNGWFFVNTYSTADLDPAVEWPAYANEILQIKLDGSEVRRLTHHRSRPFDDYNFTPRVAASRDGSRLVYSSNWGLQAILGNPAGYTDVYLLAPRVEDDDPGVYHTTCDWFPNHIGFHSAGSAVLAMQPGAHAIFSFTGTGVTWIGYRDEWSGFANVYLDGQLQATVDTFASPAQVQAELFSAAGLAAGTHALVVEVTGQRNADSGGSWVWVDAFDVISTDATVTRVEQDSPAISYPCAWVPSRLPVHSGGNAIRGMTPRAQTIFTFTGTGVSWIGYRDQSSGIGSVFVDGILRDEVDGYAASDAEPQAVMTEISGLPPGRHTLIVEVTGRQNPASGGAWVWVDAFEIIP